MYSGTGMWLYGTQQTTFDELLEEFNDTVGKEKGIHMEGYSYGSVSDLEAAQAIRRLPGEYCRKVPIFAMSANAFDDDVKRSLASGMNGHLSKPIDIPKLKEILSETLG